MEHDKSESYNSTSKHNSTEIQGAKTILNDHDSLCGYNSEK